MLGCSLLGVCGCPDLGDVPMDWQALGEGTDDPGPGAEHADVLLENMTITPDYVRLAQGGTLTWRNLDSTPHTVTSGAPEAPDGVFASPLLNLEESFTLTFAAPGAYVYFCATHPTVMRDAVIEVVGDAG